MGISGFKIARLICLASVVMGANIAQAGCPIDKVTIEGDFGRAIFSIDLADEPSERAQGLMNVPDMATMSGMLFVYEAPQRATFWMRNTLIPLDMLFVGADGRIRTIHENAVPMDETTIDGGDGVLAVVEINGGLTERLGIAVGDTVQHPAFGANAAAPCL